MSEKSTNKQTKNMRQAQGLNRQKWETTVWNDGVSSSWAHVNAHATRPFINGGRSFYSIGSLRSFKREKRIHESVWISDFFSLLFTWFYSFQFDITMWVNDFRIYVYLACNTSSTDDFMQRPTDSQILMNAIEFLFHISQILNVYRIWNWIAYAYFWVGRLFLLQFIYWFHLFLFENCLKYDCQSALFTYILEKVWS